MSYLHARKRLTLLYGSLFLVSGAALMAIAYLLLANAGFVFTLPSDGGTQIVQRGQSENAVTRLPMPGSETHPSKATMTHWRSVSNCMRSQGVSAFPEPTRTVPAPLDGVISDRDGALLAIPSTIDTESSGFIAAATRCGFIDQADLRAETHKRAQTREQLLLQSGIALTLMSLLSLGLGWLMAGRVLAPLEDSYRAQRQFVANASHELRAPLTRQRALIQVALADPDANFESLRAAHERALAAEQHLEQLIDGLLTLSRGQAGLEHAEPIDLAILAEAVLGGLQREPTGIQIRAGLAGAPVVGDPRLLERLLTNLIDNAIRHNLPDGRVDVTTGTRHKNAFISITNTGPLVPSGQVERLFQPFERLANRTQQGGHGLGLAIVQAVAKAHSAGVTARAQPGGGLAIEVVFTASQLVPSDSSLFGSEPAYVTFCPKGCERSTTTQ